MLKVRRPARTLLQLLNAREKVFRPQGIFPFRKRSRRQPVAFVWQERWRDFVFSDSWQARSAVLRQQSAKRTNENSPAIHRWVQTINREFSRRSGQQTLRGPTHTGWLSAARFTDSESNNPRQSQHSKCWAIFDRPLRGLGCQANGAGDFRFVGADSRSLLP